LKAEDSIKLSYPSTPTITTKDFIPNFWRWVHDFLAFSTLKLGDPVLDLPKLVKISLTRLVI